MIEMKKERGKIELGIKKIKAHYTHKKSFCGHYFCHKEHLSIFYDKLFPCSRLRVPHYLSQIFSI